MKRNENFHYRWVQEYDKENDRITNENFMLGKSNRTAKSKGGVAVCVFLAKDGEPLPLTAEGSEANQLMWAIVRCSEKENYDRAKARKMAFHKIFPTKKGEDGKIVPSSDRPTVLVSKNYDYDIVRNISVWLVDQTEETFTSGLYKKNQMWEVLKRNTNIDAYAAKYLPVSVSIPVNPLTASST